jgi:hypothetical protein
MFSKLWSFIKVVKPQYCETLGLGRVRLKRKERSKQDKTRTMLVPFCCDIDTSFFSYTEKKYKQWKSLSWKLRLKCQHKHRLTERYSTMEGFMSDVWEREVCEDCGSPLSTWDKVR